MDESALNYDENATVDDGSCMSDWPEPANLFFSEYAEGSSNNKYLEIYNATDGDVDLSGYSLSSCSNGCNDDLPEGQIWDYPDNVTFDAGTTVVSGDVYVVCHGSADDLIQAECDQTFTYLSNGDDVFALTQIGSGATLDVIGVVGADPGSGWDVAGISNATKDHTLVRKASVTTGNPLWLNWVDAETGEVYEQGSAGNSEDDSEWVVLDQNDWTYLGSHPHEFEVDPCADGSCDCAGVPDGDAVEDCNGECGGSAVEDCAGACGGAAVVDDCGACDAVVGDISGDGLVVVNDIVMAVDGIFKWYLYMCS